VAVDDALWGRGFTRPLFDVMEKFPGGGVAVASTDWLFNWSYRNSLWVFAMATSCCGIEFMTAAANRTDLDQMGSIPRPSPRHCDVMIVAGTVTVKMAPRIRKLWDQIPEPKWCIAMGACAISGNYFRDLYATVPGIDTMIPVDVYIPGCPPAADDVMAGLKRLQEKIVLQRKGQWVEPESRPETQHTILPEVGRVVDNPDTSRVDEQLAIARNLGLGGNLSRANDTPETLERLRRTRPQALPEEEP